MATMKQLKESMEEKVAIYVASFNNGDKKSVVSANKKHATAAINAYNEALATQQYKTWQKQGNPVELAIRSRVIPNAVKYKFKTDDDNVMSASPIVDENYSVNLITIAEVCGMKVFHEPTWFNKVQKLAYDVACYLDEHINRGLGFSYDVDEDAKETKFKKGVNTLTNEGASKALQEIFDAILYLEDPENKGQNLIKVTIFTDKHGELDSEEWRTIRESMTKNTGVNQVEICNTSTFSRYIMEKMHGLINGTNSSLVAAK